MRARTSGPPFLVNRLPRRSRVKERSGEPWVSGKTKYKSKWSWERLNRLSLNFFRGIHCACAYVGGNWNNDLNCGPFYANLNNTATNSNTNIGAALAYPILCKALTMQCVSPPNAVKESQCTLSFPHPLVKINSVQAPVSI